MGAVTGLSCPLTPDFSRCRCIQISPQHPAVFPRPQKPSCAARVTPFRQVPRAGLSPAFAYHQVTPAFPPTRRFDVAQSRSLPREREEIEGRSYASQRLSHAAPAPLRARGFRQYLHHLLPGTQPPFLGVSGQIGSLVSSDNRACGAGSPHSLVRVDKPFCVTSHTSAVA